MFANKFRYISIKLYIFITTSISLALTICILFISLIQSVNGAQFLNTTSLFLLFGGAVVPVFGTVMVEL